MNKPRARQITDGFFTGGWEVRQGNACGVAMNLDAAYSAFLVSKAECQAFGEWQDQSEESA